MLNMKNVLSNPTTLIAVLGLAATAHAHVAAWHEAMWCLNGNTGAQDLNSYDIVSPLYQLPFNQWWFHAVNGCNKFPPAPGKFIDLPAGGSFQIEIASNRAKTSLSYNGRDTSAWPDGETYPDNYNDDNCIISPNLHTKNEAGAAGTAFAISYHSDINQVRPDNLVVFTVRHRTPWRRVVHYDVPANMPPCPPEGCICAWGWVPNGCGQPNMYHQAFRCRVTNSRSNTPLAKPKPPVWCEGDESKCTKGAKQMVYWNQLEGNNVFVDGRDRRGDFKSPAYNTVMGFKDGAQNDIFAGPPSSGGSNNNNNNNGGSSQNTSTKGSTSTKPPASQPSQTPNNDKPTSDTDTNTNTDATTTPNAETPTNSLVTPPKALTENATRPAMCGASRKKRRAMREMKKREAEEAAVRKRALGSHAHARRGAAAF